MKNFLKLPIILLTLLAGISAQAALKGVPFMPESDARFDALEKNGSITEAQLTPSATAGLGVKRVAKVTFDPSGQVGQRTVAIHASGIKLPVGAIITRGYAYDATATTTASSTGTVALYCDSGTPATSPVLFPAFNWDTGGFAGFIKDGTQTGSSTPMVRVSVACNLSPSVATNAYTAGKIDFFIEYVVAE